MDKTVLITGGCRGLGKELAIAFYYANFELILNSNISTDENISVCCTHIRGDLREEATIKLLAKVAQEKDLDVLINNAAIYNNADFIDCPSEKIIEMLDVNLIVPIKLTKAIWPIFIKKQKGLIININSVAGKHGYKAGEAIYSTTKNALFAFSKSLKPEAIANNIKIVDIFLGAMKTDMTKNRPNYDKLINPIEVSTIIARLAEEHATMIVSEITITRK